MNIKTVDAFNCIIGAAASIVSHDNKISAEDAVHKAFQILTISQTAIKAWETTHNDDGSMKELGEVMGEILNGKHGKFSEELQEKLMNLKNTVEGI